MSAEKFSDRPYKLSGEQFLPDWFRKAQKRSLTNIKKEGTFLPPFSSEIFSQRQYLGEGEEQIVYGFPKDTPLASLVIKESKQSIPKFAAVLAQLAVGKGVENILTWPEAAAIKQYDMNVMSAVFGPQVLRADYVHGYASDGSGRVTNYCIQERFEGTDLWTKMKKEKEVLQDPFIREQLLRITWGTKRILLDLHATPDINQGRNILINDEKRVVLSDASSASFLGDVAGNQAAPFPARYYMTSRIEKELRFVTKLEEKLQPTKSEKAQLSESFQVSDNEFFDKLAMLKKQKTLWNRSDN